MTKKQLAEARKILAREGGKARVAKLSPEQLSQRMREMSLARWQKQKKRKSQTA
jgi:hypothetical protein